MPVLVEHEALVAARVSVPASVVSAEPNLDRFFDNVTSARQCALLLDFDGTLAPFRLDPQKVRPWSGVTTLLERIQSEGRTRLAIISGRPARQVKLQLGLSNPPEIWGLHGSERLFPDGKLELEELAPLQQRTLGNAKNAITKAHLSVRSEDKWNAVVLHWRGKSPHAAEAAKTKSLALLQPFLSIPGMALLQFDGGVELRAGRNKGDAVRLLLKEMPIDAPVAYLGDDTTDEDAFKALASRGLAVLVRREWRPGAAQLWLRPPGQLNEFLTRWTNAVSAPKLHA